MKREMFLLEQMKRISELALSLFQVIESHTSACLKSLA